MAMNYREEIEETGIIDLKEIIDSENTGTENGEKKLTIKEKIEQKFSHKKKEKKQ
jgi:hypothetical protein